MTNVLLCLAQTLCPPSPLFLPLYRLFILVAMTNVHRGTSKEPSLVVGEPSGEPFSWVLGRRRERRCQMRHPPAESGSCAPSGSSSPPIAPARGWSGCTPVCYPICSCLSPGGSLLTQCLRNSVHSSTNPTMVFLSWLESSVLCLPETQVPSTPPYCIYSPSIVGAPLPTTAELVEIPEQCQVLPPN